MAIYICKKCQIEKSEAPFCHGPMQLKETADDLPAYINIVSAVFELHIGKGDNHYTISYQTPGYCTILKYITDKTMEGAIQKMLAWIRDEIPLKEKV